MVMLWNLVVLVGFVVERGGGQKAGHPTYALLTNPRLEISSMDTAEVPEASPA